MSGSIVFVDDDDDGEGSVCSVQNADDATKPDVRRGILRNATNIHGTAGAYVNSRPSDLPITSTNEPHLPVVRGGARVFWPSGEATKHPQFRRDPVSQNGNSFDFDHAVNDAGRAESLEHETGNGAAAAMRKKLTVRFSPEPDDARAPDMRTAAAEVRGQVEGCPGAGEREHRRVNVGRIAENKFNDGRNHDVVSADTTASDTSKAGRKWYHFSFRSNKNREKSSAAEVGGHRMTSSEPRLICAEPRSDHGDVDLRCRGRREMRESSTYDAGAGGYARTLAAQGYRMLSTSASEPEQLGGHSPWGTSGASVGDRTHQVISMSSAYDLRRSPTVADGRKSRGVAAVRRSRSTVGDERRRPPTASLTSLSTSFHRKRERGVHGHSHPKTMTFRCRPSFRSTGYQPAFQPVATPRTWNSLRPRPRRAPSLMSHFRRQPAATRRPHVDGLAQIGCSIVNHLQTPPTTRLTGSGRSND